jgi:RHH-type transcriptional regulator, rel operon repressor / antitoxin RelB
MTDVTVTVRMSSKDRERLESVAKASQRSKSFVANEAILRFLTEEEAHIDGINAALEEMYAGQGIPHDEAMHRVRSTIARVTKQSA